MALKKSKNTYKLKAEQKARLAIWYTNQVIDRENDPLIIDKLVVARTHLKAGLKELVDVINRN